MHSVTVQTRSVKGCLTPPRPWKEGGACFVIEKIERRPMTPLTRNVTPKICERTPVCHFQTPYLCDLLQQSLEALATQFFPPALSGSSAQRATQSPELVPTPLLWFKGSGSLSREAPCPGECISRAWP